MDLLLFHLEIASLSGLLVGTHALRRWLGAAPLYLATGVLLAFLVISGRLGLMVALPGGLTAPYGALVHLSAILVAVALVYTLESTTEARRMIAGLLLGSAVTYAFKAVVGWRLLEGDFALAALGREAWAKDALSMAYGACVSTLALLIDGVVILVVYQWGLNAVGRRLPVFVALTLALTAAMVADGLVFRALQLELGVLPAELLGKLLAGLAAATPAGVYISLSLRRQGAARREVALSRGALDIVALRRALESARRELAETRADLDHVKHVFSRYLVPDLVEEIASTSEHLELGGELKEVTVLFSDIRGYGRLSEHMAPAEVIDLLNEYFALMSAVIDRHRGTIIEFEGDEILAVFGAPLAQPDHATRAARTAVAMLESVEGLNRRWALDGTARHWLRVGLPDFRIRLGIHSGDVVVGNVGSETRVKYAVIGDTVNTAARVKSLNKRLRTTVLLSEVTAHALRAPEIGLQPLGQHAVKGRAETVEVFTIHGQDEPTDHTEDFSIDMQALGLREG